MVLIHFSFCCCTKENKVWNSWPKICTKRLNLKYKTRKSNLNPFRFPCLNWLNLICLNYPLIKKRQYIKFMHPFFHLRGKCTIQYFHEDVLRAHCYSVCQTHFRRGQRSQVWFERTHTHYMVCLGFSSSCVPKPLCTSDQSRTLHWRQRNTSPWLWCFSWHHLKAVFVPCSRWKNQSLTATIQVMDNNLRETKTVRFRDDVVYFPVCCRIERRGSFHSWILPIKDSIFKELKHSYGCLQKISKVSMKMFSL